MYGLDLEARIKSLEDALKKQKTQNKKLSDTVSQLNQQIAKSNLLVGTGIRDQSAGVCVSGVCNIDESDLVFGEQISQGGFSVVYKGNWRSAHVAIKRIFDPVKNEELMSEINNEVLMLSILRHPNIVLLLGISQSDNISLVMEYPKGGTLFEVLHKYK